MPLHFALLAKGLKVLRSFVNRSAGNAGAWKGTATLGEPPINKGSSSQSLFLIGAVWKVITSYYIWAFKPYKIRNLSDRDPETYIPPLELHMPRRPSFWPVYVSKMGGMNQLSIQDCLCAAMLHICHFVGFWKLGACCGGPCYEACTISPHLRKCIWSSFCRSCGTRKEGPVFGP